MISNNLPNSTIELKASGLGKRFNREWIFKEFNFAFQQGKTYAVTGPNGSGKSTLLQILWGQLPQTKGTIEYTINSVKIPVEEIYKEVSIATPYLDLIEEYTLQEFINFHFSIKKVRDGFNKSELLDRMELTHAKDKLIGNFSSGMRQRVKLSLSFFTQSRYIFLDEPHTNLDRSAIDWCKKQLSLLTSGIVFIASNDPEEYSQASEIISISNFK